MKYEEAVQHKIDRIKQAENDLEDLLMVGKRKFENDISRFNGLGNDGEGDPTKDWP